MYLERKVTERSHGEHDPGAGQVHGTGQDHSGHDHIDGHVHKHAHDHNHNHDHAGHSHAPKVSAGNERAVLIGLCLTGGFMVAEVIGGYLSGSLALIADAGHMLTDFAALALGWFAFRLARKPSDARRTFGYDRFQVLVAFVNGLALFLIAVALFITGAVTGDARIMA